MRGVREAVRHAAEAERAPQRAHGPRARQVHALQRHLPPVLQHGAAQVTTTTHTRKLILLLHKFTVFTVVFKRS